MTTCWDLALPKDEPDIEFLCESENYRVLVYCDRHNEQRYQGQFKSSFLGGGWLDDSDCDTWDEDKALAWWEDAVNPVELESEEESDREWAEFHAEAQEIELKNILEID